MYISATGVKILLTRCWKSKEAFFMNIFDKKLKETGNYPLKAKEVNTLEANVGYKCNLTCSHCYVEASPSRTEEMPLNVINKILNVLRKTDAITIVDITGGAPELNPHFKYLVKSASDIGKNVMVRSNLAICTEPGMEDIPEFLAENKIKILASLPCYTEQGVDSQRGKGTYKKVITVLKRLNKLGYGVKGSSLKIDLVFNPLKASIAPDRQMIENIYREKLKEMHNIIFNHVIALNNAPVGRMRKSMSEDELKTFMRELEEKFNPNAVENLMCRYIINVSYEGKLYDCDCTQITKLPVKTGNASIDNFDYEKLKNREIVTMPLCFMCTAGAGSSCIPINK